MYSVLMDILIQCQKITQLVNIADKHSAADPIAGQIFAIPQFSRHYFLVTVTTCYPSSLLVLCLCDQILEKHSVKFSRYSPTE